MEPIECRMLILKNYLWIMLITIIVAYLLLKYIKFRIWAAKIDRISGPTSIPIVGNILSSELNRTKFGETISKRFSTYGPIYRLWMAWYPVIIIRKAEYMEPLLCSTKNIKKSLYSFLAEWLGDGLLTSYGSKWHARRKLITPTFHYKMLEIFHNVFINKADILVERLKNKCDNGIPFDLQPYITDATLDVICETALGTNINVQGTEESEYVKAVYQICTLLIFRSMRIWLYPEKMFKMIKRGKIYFNLLNTLHNYTKKIIQERKMSRSKIRSVQKCSIEEEDIGMKNKTAFLDVLLKAAEDGENIDENSIREEVDTFMFEGHDTTAAGISFCLYLLGLHSDCQERVVNEIISVVGKDRTPTIQDMSEMKYLDLVLKEAFRLYPPVPMIGRDLEEDIAFDNVIVPTGTSAILFIYFLHRDERFFPNPEKFDPDRFLPENVKGRHPYAYLPFSAGPRNCIGKKFAFLEVKVIIATLLRKFKITSVDKPDEIKLLFELVLKSNKGINVVLENRDL